MSNIRKKSIAGLLILVMLASAVLIPQAGEVKATGEAKDISEGPIELTGGGEYILTGTTTTAANVVTIEASDQPYVVTLDNVSISSTKIPVTVKAGAKVTFISKTGTENSFTTTTNRISAIEVQTGSTVIFEGDGTVNATSTQHAGAIGAGRYDATSQGAYVAEDKDFGTIIINSGIINAKCTSGGGAGIGGGYNTAGGTIIINGGNITATSANNAAAIGDGYVSASKAIVKNTEVIINGGTISTTTVGGDGGRVVRHSAH